MKKSFNHFSILTILVVISLATILNSCKKDKKENLPTNYRLTSLESSEDGDIYKLNYTYNGVNKIQRFSAFENGEEYYRNDWAYNGDKVTITSSDLYQDEWHTSDIHQTLLYSGGHVTESNIYLKDTLLYKTIYTWNGDLLSKEASNILQGDTINYISTVNYIYDGTRLTRAEWSNGNVQVIEYHDGKPVALKLYNVANELEESSQMVYTGNNISKVNSFHISQGIQGDTECTETRIYDANNCVTTISNSCTNQYFATSQITYEKGASNFNDFLLTQVSWISVYLFPNSFPCELAYKKKK